MQNIGTTSVVLAAAVGIAIFPFATATASDNQVAPAPATSNPRWSATFAEEVRLFSWRSNVVPGFPVLNGGRGSELYIPYALQLTGKPTDNVSVDIVGRGGWVRASQMTPGLSGSVATTTDT